MGGNTHGVSDVTNICDDHVGIVNSVVGLSVVLAVCALIIIALQLLLLLLLELLMLMTTLLILLLALVM